MRPDVGMTFRHKRLRRYVPGKRMDDCPAMVCTVTHINDTTVYYRDETGKRRSTDLMCFSSIVDQLTVPTGFGGLAFSDQS